MSKLISLRLDEGLHQRIESEASLLTAKRGEAVSKSTVIAIAVARYFDVKIDQDWDRDKPQEQLDIDGDPELPFRCRMNTCDFRAGTEAARCPHHGGKLVANV